MPSSRVPRRVLVDARGLYEACPGRGATAKGTAITR
jgi:hypothetical protein